MFESFTAAGKARRLAFDALSRHVAEACVEAVTRLVAQRWGTMSVCEMRGYIRGRSGLAIRRQVRLALERTATAPPEWEQPLAVAAAERIAPLVMRRLAGSVPAAHLSRAAA